MASLVARCLGAARLDAATYEEVEADPSATGQAVLVVVLAAVAAGIAAAHLGIPGIIGGTIASILAWFVWAAMVWFFGTKFMPEPETQASVGQVVRTTGFSASPGILQILGIVPALAGIVGLVTSLWMLASMVVAVRQALDYKSTVRAVLVSLVGFVAYVGVFVLIALAFGVTVGLVEALRGAAT